jgi:hypothetical protein
METRKTVRRNISGRLLKVLSADEQERQLEDRVHEEWDDEMAPVLIEEPTPGDSEEITAEEAATETGFVRHIGESRPD